MITLASDFGSPYPAAMKGVLCQRTNAQLIDIAHGFPRGDIRIAAFWLREILPYFPPATHLVVVDPGVGTDRDAVVVRAGAHSLVGPDNGVLLPAARRLAEGDAGGDRYQLEAFRIDETATGSELLAIPSTADQQRSSTFHGRDVFAPAAGAVHETPIERLGELAGLDPIEEPSSLVSCSIPAATVVGDRAVGEVLVVDGFGNVITNVPGEYVQDCESIVANGESVPVGGTFGSVPQGNRVATVGSHGYVELDVNDGRGDDAFGLEPGDDVVLEFQ